jgi:hypothetical protein
MGDALAWAQSQLSAPRRNTSEGDAIDKATRSRSAPPSSALRGALRKTTSEEIDSAIEAAAMVFKAEPRISRDALYKRLFEGGTCTFNRFRTKIWQPARQKAGLPPHAPKGRRPEK